MQICRLTLLVRDYDEAIEFYTQRLGFVKQTDDNWGEGFRFVVLSAAQQPDFQLIITRATDDDLLGLVGRQAGYHQFFALRVSDCAASYAQLKANGIDFISEPREMMYGTEASFRDLYGNIIGLISPVVL
ncbi:hypothetical protein SAMN05421780_108165 [Flexibacter flexilis DSM 6793]|uniref:VOC domain-containing protein n=1 Tax=Flexibacter flexilis DSM 6793 TaxID=927664 RepID=A0A1I1LC80_9BACT|nr:VOC family protein [Flexibacter flexilis]SFC70694.1 hypothetical protein SAMN05421780_108165 [Flexibacter flexilis DSM 6793]